jgi:hypothetical protein
MIPSLIEFSPRPDLVRRTVESRRLWIESKLGVSLAECVLLEVSIDLAQIALERELNLATPQASTRASKLLRKLVIGVEVPPDELPMVVMSKALPLRQSWLGFQQMSQAEQKPRLLRADLVWADSPVLIRLNFVRKPIIAWTISCHRGPGASEEEPFNLLIVPRQAIERIIRIVDLLDRPDRTPKLITLHADSQRVLPCAWSEMTLTPEVTRLLREDFEFFIANKKWFHKAQLPHRRGYLLHGPPGNGKTTAIRCMMSAYGLTAYTIRLFDRQSDDSTLDDLFKRALKNSPAIVLLEDIDRAFPRTGESECGISLQHLLNTLDGIATGEGIIVVATANEPVLLDPAILKRPGRFDRTIFFGAPDPTMRASYFSQRIPSLPAASLEVLAKASDGFSYAQLRETYIIAAQCAFIAQRDVSLDDLLESTETLRGSERSDSMISATRLGRC